MMILQHNGRETNETLIIDKFVQKGTQRARVPASHTVSYIYEIAAE